MLICPVIIRYKAPATKIKKNIIKNLLCIIFDNLPILLSGEKTVIEKFNKNRLNKKAGRYIKTIKKNKSFISLN